MGRTEYLQKLEEGLVKNIKATGLDASKETFIDSMQKLFSEHEKIVDARKKISLYSIHREIEANMSVYSTEVDNDKMLSDKRREYRDKMIESLRKVDVDPILLGYIENGINAMKNILMREPKSEYAALLKKESPELAKKMISIEHTPFFGNELVAITQMKLRQDLIDLETEDTMYATYEQLKLEERRSKQKPSFYM